MLILTETDAGVLVNTVALLLVTGIKTNACLDIGRRQAVKNVEIGDRGMTASTDCRLHFNYILAKRGLDASKKTGLL